jgi:hypothetical protein
MDLIAEALQSLRSAVADGRTLPDSVFELGEKRKVTVSAWKNLPLVNFREFYADTKTGEEKPGNKGIALNVDQFTRLMGQVSTSGALFACLLVGCVCVVPRGSNPKPPITPNVSMSTFVLWQMGVIEEALEAFKKQIAIVGK